MNQMRVTEAKARFAELLRTVEHGETVVTICRGRAVVHVTPAHEVEREDYSETVARFCCRLQELEPVDMSIKEIFQARHEGHRWRP